MAQKRLLVAGGPNGAGKTTFVRKYLTLQPQLYLSADAIAAELAPHDVASAQLAAGRLFLERFDNAILQPDDFIVESTLSGKSLRNGLQRAREAGFEIEVYFVYLASAESSERRVAERVRKGGHDVPTADIHRRFVRTLKNFWDIYRPLADLWTLIYNDSGEFLNVASGKGDDLSIYEQELFASYLLIVEGQDYE